MSDMLKAKVTDLQSEIGTLSEELQDLRKAVFNYTEQHYRVFSLGYDNAFERQELYRMFAEMQHL